MATRKHRHKHTYIHTYKNRHGASTNVTSRLKEHADGAYVCDTVQHRKNEQIYRGEKQQEILLE